MLLAELLVFALDDELCSEELRVEELGFDELCNTLCTDELRDELERLMMLDDERRTELLDRKLLELERELEATGATLDVTTLVQTAPEIRGACAFLAPLVPCIPNSILAPRAIVRFQLKGAAE